MVHFSPSIIEINFKNHISFPVRVQLEMEITAAILFQKLINLRWRKGKHLTVLMKNL